MEATPIHPICAMLPALTPSEYKDLVQSIRDHGQREDIILFEDMILDGRHREKACLEAGLTPRYDFFLGDYDAAASRVLTRLWSRSINKGQRAMIAAKMATHKAGRPKQPSQNERISADGEELSERISLPDAARDANVSVGHVARARGVNAKSEVLAQAVLDKTISLGNAEKLKDASPEVQLDIIDALKNGKSIKQAVAENPEASKVMKPNGSPIDFDDKKLTDAMAKLIRLVDEKLKACGKKEPHVGFHKQIMASMNIVAGTWKQWKSK